MSESESQELRPSPYLSRIHAVIFLIPALGFALAMLLGGNFAILGGPYAGSIYRDWQSCCTEVSVSLSYWGLAAIGVGLALQFMIKPGSLNRVRYWVWALSFVPWLLACFPSLAHAVS